MTTDLRKLLTSSALDDLIEHLKVLHDKYLEGSFTTEEYIVKVIELIEE